MSESSQVIPLALVEFTRRGGRMFRNFVGGAWVGKLYHKGAVLVQLKNARMVKAGLCEGSSDLIGWTPYTVGPDDVGRTLAVFTAAECKTEAYKTLTTDQRTFLDAVVRSGGMAYVVRETLDGVNVTEWPSKELDKV